MMRRTGRLAGAHVRAVAVVLLASSAIPSGAAVGKPVDDVVVVKPSSLPESVRRPADAMFLHETIDGRSVLYVEQAGGAEIAVLDVTHPDHVEAGGLVSLGAPGIFDVTTMLGSRAALVQFRRNHNYAVLDLRDPQHPFLRTVGRDAPPGALPSPGGERIAGPSSPDQVVAGAGGPRQATPAYPVSGVRDSLTNDATGTIFLLTEDGLYLIRRTDVEFSRQRQQAELAASAGG